MSSSPTVPPTDQKPRPAPPTDQQKPRPNRPQFASTKDVQRLSQRLDKQQATLVQLVEALAKQNDKIEQRNANDKIDAALASFSKEIKATQHAVCIKQFPRDARAYAQCVGTIPHKQQHKNEKPKVKKNIESKPSEKAQDI